MYSHVFISDYSSHKVGVLMMLFLFILFFYSKTRNIFPVIMNVKDALYIKIKSNHIFD